MKLLTMFVSWLIGYYYDECDVCGRYYAILNNGQFVVFCSKRAHDRAEAALVPQERFAADAKKAPPPPAVDLELAHAAKLLALTVTDNVLAAVQEYDCVTNMRVLEHWRDAVLRRLQALAPETKK